MAHISSSYVEATNPPKTKTSKKQNNTGKTARKEKDLFQNFQRFSDWNIEQLKDPEDAKLYLQVALEEYQEDGDTEFFLMSLRDVIKAQGGIGQLAERTSLNRQSLYKALSAKGNPRLDTLMKILHGLGYRLSVETLDR